MPAKEERILLTPVAWIAVSFYAFGLVGVIGLLLLLARDAIMKGQPTPLSAALRFVYKEYEPWAYWWELLEMGRRLFLVGVMVLFNRGTLMQLAAGTLFSAAFLVVQMQVRFGPAYRAFATVDST